MCDRERWASAHPFWNVSDTELVLRKTLIASNVLEFEEMHNMQLNLQDEAQMQELFVYFFYDQEINLEIMSNACSRVKKYFQDDQEIVNGILDRIRGISKALCAVSNFGFAADSSEKFLSFLMQRFDEILGSCKEFVHSTFSWLKEVWNKVKEWAASIVDKVTSIASHLSGGVLVSISIISMATLLHALESLLKGFGMCSDVGFARIFLLAVGTFLSTKWVLSVTEPIQKETQDIVSKLCCEIVAYFPGKMWGCFFPSTPKNPLDPESILYLNFSPISLATTALETMSKFSASKVVEVGRFCNALEQIKKSYGSMKEVVASILQFLAETMGTLTGTRSRFLQDASVLIGLNVSNWINRCDAFYRDSIAGTLPLNAVDIGNDLLYEGRKIQKGLQDGKIQLSHVYINQVSRLTEKVQLITANLERAGDDQPRITPYVIGFVGPSRTGKSELRQKLNKYLCDQLNLSGQSVYTRNSSDKFWSHYAHQYITSFDDLGAVGYEQGKTDEADFIHLVSSAPFGLNMAELGEKGTYFTSKVITYSSNFTLCSPHSGVKTPEAFNNRRNMLFKITRREGSQYDPSDITKCQVIEMLDPENGRVLMNLDTMLDEDFRNIWEVLTNLIKVDMEQFMQKEKTVLAVNQTGRPTLKQELNTIGKIFALAQQFQCPETFRFFEENSDVALLGSFKGKFWGIHQEDGSFQTVDITDRIKTNRLREIMQFECESVSSMILMAHKSLPISHSSKLYFNEMVEHDMVAPNLSILSPRLGDPSLEEVLKEEPDWFKVVVGTVHEASFSKKNKKGMASKAMDHTYNMLSSAYNTEISNWPLSVKVLAGMLVVLLGGSTVFSMLRRVVGALSNKETSSLAGSYMNSDAFNSRRKGNAESAPYRFRNKSVRAQMTYANSDERDPILSCLEIMRECCVQINFPGGKKLMSLQLPGRRLLLLKHYIHNVKNPQIVKIIDGKDQATVCCFRPSELVHFSESEFCVWSNDSIPPGRKSIYEYMEFDPMVNCGTKFEAYACMVNPTKEDTQDYAVIHSCNAEVVRATKTMHGSAYINEIPISIAYQCVNSNFDCGSLLLARQKVGKKLVIVGLHICGDRIMNSSAGLLPFFPKPISTELDFYERVNSEVISDDLCIVGKVKTDMSITSVTKTAYEKTPENFHLGFPVLVEPAILSKGDPRIRISHPEFCPHRKGMLKYAYGASVLNDKILDLVAVEISENQKKCFGEIPGFLSLHEAMNGYSHIDFCEGLVISTSEGYPHVLSRGRGEKGKARFLEGELGSLKLKEGTSVEIAYKELVKELDLNPVELVCIDCPKDEKLPLRKIYQDPKTRLFSILPMEFNLYCRQLFLTYMSSLMINRHILPAKVGVNPYSSEWNAIAKYLLKTSDVLLCCDYSSFDGLLTNQLLSKIADIIEEVLPKDQYRKARRNMLMSLLGRYSICKQDVYQCKAGLPSGFAMTVIINSILNEILVRYVYRIIMMDYPVYADKFDELVSIVIYGDDNLIAIHPSIQLIFTGEKLQSEMARIGITIKDGTDKTLPTLLYHRIDDVDFLQRKFKMDDHGTYRGPLNEKSLLSQLVYVKTKEMSMFEAYEVAANNVLREMYLHGRYKEFKDKFSKLQGINLSLNTYEQIHNFHEANMGRGEVIQSELESLISPRLLGSLVEEIPGPQEFQILPRVWITARMHRDSGYEIGCGAGINRLTWNATEGRGFLPSPAWMDRTMNPKGEFIRKMKTIYNEGRELVVYSPDLIEKSMVIGFFMCNAMNLITKIDLNETLAHAAVVSERLGYVCKNYSSRLL